MKITKQALKSKQLEYHLLLGKIDLWSDAMEYYQIISKKLIWIKNRLEVLK